jgi:hypothetical protein
MIPFAQYCQTAALKIENSYGVRVITRDVPDPLIGDLDGAEIHIDYAVTPEQRLFLLGHLFGHTVQWNTNPDAFEIGRPRRPPVAQAVLPSLMKYEQEAAGYGLTLFREAGITSLDHWLADYTACDLAYLFHFYTTGEVRDFQGFWRDGADLIQARPIPPFHPKALGRRSDGIVI